MFLSCTCNGLSACDATDEKTVAMSTITLKTVVFIGSAKTLVPPWGGASRLGDRVVEHVKQVLAAREVTIGADTIRHEVTYYDPIEVFSEGGALAGDGALSEPHFFFGKDKAPPAMQAMRDVINSADCYVVVTPEYNHTIPPALSSMMGHFGGSNYALKASAICTYSFGAWGGARAAMALRPMLSELGCLPVSKMTHFPSPNDLFETDGKPKDAEHRMLKQLPEMLGQLEWMACAMKAQRAKGDPPK